MANRGRYEGRNRPDVAPFIIVVLAGLIPSAALAEPAGTTPFPHPTSDSHPVPKTAIAIIALAATAGAVGTLFGVQALSSKAKFDDGDRTTARLDDIERKALLSDIGFGAALALGVSALVLCFGHDDEPAGLRQGLTDVRSVTLRPIRLAGGAGAAAGFRF